MRKGIALSFLGHINISNGFNLIILYSFEWSPLSKNKNKMQRFFFLNECININISKPIIEHKNEEARFQALNTLCDDLNGYYVFEFLLFVVEIKLIEEFEN